MNTYFMLKRSWKWTIFLASMTVVCNTMAIKKWNNITLIVRDGGNIQSYTKNVNQCIWLPKVNVTGKLIGVQLQDQGNCAEIYKFKDCIHDYITLKTGVPARNDITNWNLNYKREWIEEGAKAVGPCRDECDETILSPAEPYKTFRITLHSELDLAGLMESVTIKGCKVIPKPLRNKASSLTYDGSFCVELHQTRDCSEDSIRIPKETPYPLLYNLQAWGFDKKAVAVSRCGYNCSISRLKSEKEEFSIKRWTGDTEYEVGVTLYSEPDFEGENQTYTFNRTDGTCFEVPHDVWNKKGKTESIQAYNFCIDVFEKNTICERVEGEYLRLNYSNEKGRDIIALGLSGGIKSIALCPSPTSPTNDPSVEISPPEGTSFWTYIVIGFAIALVFIGIIILRKFRNCYQKHKETKVLTHREMIEFKKGNQYATSENENDTEESEEALLRPYDDKFELRKTNVQIYSKEILGKGAFGVAFKGKLLNHECVDEVAIKTTGAFCTATSVKMLLSEIKIMIHVGKHSNVVSILGACTADAYSGKVLLVVELCKNGSLETYLRTHFLTMSDSYTQNTNDTSDVPTEVMEKLLMWSYHIASGMEHISSKKITHADLATRNVLLTTELVAKITDFGLSRHIYNYKYKNYVKLNDSEPLPWRWMAIESLNLLNFSTKSDVWAYGVTVWEIFSLGRTPYPGIGWTADFVSKLEGGYRLHKPSVIDQSIIYETMLTCWLSNPDSRPNFTQLKTFFKDLVYKNGSTIYAKMNEIIL